MGSQRMIALFSRESQSFCEELIVFYLVRLSGNRPVPAGAGLSVDGLQFPNMILAVSNAQTGATVPIDEYSSYIINESNGSLISRLQLSVIWIVHGNELNASSFRICVAKMLHYRRTRKLIIPHSLSPLFFQMSFCQARVRFSSCSCRRDCEAESCETAYTHPR